MKRAIPILAVLALTIATSSTAQVLSVNERTECDTQLMVEMGYRDGITLELAHRNKDRGTVLFLEVLNSEGEFIRIENSELYGRGTLSLEEIKSSAEQQVGEPEMVRVGLVYPDESQAVMQYNANFLEIADEIVFSMEDMTDYEIDIMGLHDNWQHNNTYVRRLVDGSHVASCLRAGHCGDDMHYRSGF